MAIRWFCDLCGEEIISVDRFAPEGHPVQVRLYTESVNRDLNGYGESEYLLKKVGHADCIKKLTQRIFTLVNGPQT